MDNTVKLCERVYYFFSSVLSDNRITGDAGTQKNVTTWSFEKGVPNQQVGNVWANPHEIISLSMGGELSVVDVREGNVKVTRVIQVYLPITIPLSNMTLTMSTPLLLA